MCYMTRISEPQPFSAADSVYTEVTLVVKISMTWLTPPASGPISVTIHVYVDGCFKIKMREV